MQLTLNIPGSKKCTKCGTEKPFDQFCHCKYRKSGLNSKCKNCLYEERKQYLLKNPEQAKKFNGRWDKEHPEHARERSHLWRKANKKRFADSVRKWRQENPGRNKELQERWHKEHPGKSTEYTMKRRSTPAGALNARISCLTRKYLREGKSRRHWEDLLGFTVKELKKHLEKRFLPGMSWDNMKLWDIDHKIPLIAFNFETPEDIDFRRAWKLKNLRPMWAIDNRKKGGKIESPFQPALALSLEKRNASNNINCAGVGS